MEQKIIEILLKVIEYNYLIFPFIGVLSMGIFIETSKGAYDITSYKRYNKLLLQFSVSIIFITGALYTSYKYLPKNIEVKALIALTILLLLYAIYKLFFKKDSSNTKKIIAQQQSYSSVVNAIDKKAFRKSNQKKNKNFYTIKLKLKRLVEAQHKFVDMYKNNINLITKMVIKEEFLEEQYSLKKQALSAKTDQLNKLHLELIRLTKAAYLQIDNERKVLSVNNKINSIKFPISRLKLDYIIFQEYKKSLSTYINPMMNLMWLAEDTLDRELIGACQNASMVKNQPYGYLYYKIFVDIENSMILKKNMKTIYKLSKQSHIDINSKFYVAIQEEFKKYDESFKMVHNGSKFDTDKYLFETYKDLLSITTDKLSNDNLEQIAEIKEFYKDKDNEEIYKLEEEKLSASDDEEIQEIENKIIEIKKAKEEAISSLKGEMKDEYERKEKEQERKNLIIKNLDKMIHDITFPTSKIELDMKILKEYNRMRFAANKQQIPLFFERLLMLSSSIVDRELIGAFENLHKENFDSIGYTYYKIFETK